MKNIFVRNVPRNLVLQFVRKHELSRNLSILYNLFDIVKPRRNQHRRDYSDANAENKVSDDRRKSEAFIDKFELEYLVNRKWYNGFRQ